MFSSNLKQQQSPAPPPPPALYQQQLTYPNHHQSQQQKSYYTKSKKLSTKLKSSSLDNDIFLQNRKNNNQSSSDWLLPPHGCATIPRAASTNSLASTVTASNYQEYKAEIINQVSNRWLIYLKSDRVLLFAIFFRNCTAIIYFILIRR